MNLSNNTNLMRDIAHVEASARPDSRIANALECCANAKRQLGMLAYPKSEDGATLNFILNIEKLLKG